VAAFDTNVLVRVLVGDDPAQTKKAERAFEVHAGGAEGVYISLVVVAELAWVLTAAYRWDRAAIHGRLSRLVRTRGVVLEDLELVESALDAYLVGKADLADYLILGKARSVSEELLTFDKRLAREPGVTLVH
jgi:predicted nucleic-acid-binding protein